MVNIAPTMVKTHRRPPGGRKASKERIAAMAAANRPTVANVRVVATSDALRRVLVHPSGRKLRTSGATEWPMDKFTARRLAEGAIKIEKAEEKKPEENKERERHAQHRSAPSTHQAS